MVPTKVTTESRIRCLLTLLMLSSIAGCYGDPADDPEPESAGQSVIDNTDIQTTARSYLVNGKNESLGYGLYSYLLLNKPKDEAETKRCLAAISAYHLLFSTVEDVRQYDRTPRFLISRFLPPNRANGSPERTRLIR